MARKNPIPLREAEMVALARVAVFEDADWLTAAQVAAIAGSSEKNLSARLQEAAVVGRVKYWQFETRKLAHSLIQGAHVLAPTRS